MKENKEKEIPDFDKWDIEKIDQNKNFGKNPVIRTGSIKINDLKSKKMAITTTYTCNLCGAIKQPKDLMQLFLNNGAYILIESDDTRKSHRHICKSCIKTILNSTSPNSEE